MLQFVTVLYLVVKQKICLYEFHQLCYYLLLTHLSLLVNPMAGKIVTRIANDQFCTPSRSDPSPSIPNPGDKSVQDHVSTVKMTRSTRRLD